MQDLLFRSPDFLGWLATVGLMLLRYIIFAGVPFLLFYYIRRKEWFHRKIQQKFPKKSQVQDEIRYSVQTFLIFATIKMGLIWLVVNDYTAAYFNISDYPMWYLPLSFIVLIFIHDTWFYWAHRAMHLPKLFKPMHRVHHLSTNPTPWASFSFQASEAVAEFIWMVPVVIFMPLNVVVLLLFILWMIVFNVLGHSGYEIYPRNFLKTPFGKFFNTPTHHNMHHKLFKGNYGLYFNVWDRLMGTNFPQYDAVFEEVTTRPKTESDSEIIPNLKEQLE